MDGERLWTAERRRAQPCLRSRAVTDIGDPEAARAEGVFAVHDVLVARGSDAAADSIPIAGLELPEILGLSVVVGPPVARALVRGSSPQLEAKPLLPVPVVAETC